LGQGKTPSDDVRRPRLSYAKFLGAAISFPSIFLENVIKNYEFFQYLQKESFARVEIKLLDLKSRSNMFCAKTISIENSENPQKLTSYVQFFLMIFHIPLIESASVRIQP
jgi:hypothetical protein